MEANDGRPAAKLGLRSCFKPIVVCCAAALQKTADNQTTIVDAVGMCCGAAGVVKNVVVATARKSGVVIEIEVVPSVRNGTRLVDRMDKRLIRAGNIECFESGSVVECSLRESVGVDPSNGHVAC